MIPDISFDPVRAVMLAQASSAAYHAADVICALTDTQCLVEETEDSIDIAFRGTKNLRDWITDADFFKVAITTRGDIYTSGSEKHSDIKVHHGFLTAIDSILPALVGKLLPPGVDKSKVKPLDITGHSLGGALATEAAFFLEQEGFNVRSVYTFGSPRVGNAAWRKAYNDLLGHKTFRVIAPGDIVPLVPGLFCPPIDGFRHVGTEVLLTTGSPIVNPSHVLELLLDSWRAYRAIKRGDVDFILEFHSIDNDYLKLLKA